MKRPALQNKQVGVLQMAFRARKVFGTFEKRAPGHQFSTDGPEVVKIRVLSLQVVYSWPSLYLSLHTLVIGLEATQVYHMIPNHNSRS